MAYNGVRRKNDKIGSGEIKKRNKFNYSIYNCEIFFFVPFLEYFLIVAEIKIAATSNIFIELSNIGILIDFPINREIGTIGIFIRDSSCGV